MIDRYSRSEMSEVWSLHSRFQSMLEVEQNVAHVQAGMKLIPAAAAKDIQKKARFQLERIHEIEKQTKHDVLAFLTNVAENIGPNGRYLHFGMTSSDVLDTAFSLQVMKAWNILEKDFLQLEKVLSRLMKEHKKTLCVGRTHGIFAEPTSFGLKMAGFLAEFQRHHQRVERAVDQMKICKLSGAVGTYSSQEPAVEEKVARRLGLKIETVATQVVPRDRHAELILSLAQLGGGIERLAVELRHLQRSEVNEVIESFAAGQKGSSAMPHKKNPISAENLTGQARLLRSYALPAMENVALWHERDISHSAVERVIFPDAFILADYALDRLTQLLQGLGVDQVQMQKNMDLSQGRLFSSHVLLALVEKGMPREQAYQIVQKTSMSLGPKDHLQKQLMKDPSVASLLKSKDLEQIFSGRRHLKFVDAILSRLKVKS
jgi:adenylosuccinate lyase